jgi:hypothetical protein
MPIPPTRSCRPAGLVWKVSRTFFGLKRRLTVAESPLESVAVRRISR